MKADLIALKPMRYGTRRLMAGDAFEAREPYAGILVAIKKARHARAVGSIAPPPVDVSRKIAESFPDTNIAAVRAEYQRVTGKRPFMGWDAATLRQKMAEAE